MRVLIVDDSVVFRSAIRTALERLPGIEVVGAAANGKIALEKIKQLSVDLITLDMEMPDLDGIETLKQLRAAGHRQTVVVFSSMTTLGAERAIDALRFGADEVVAKPAQSEEGGIEGAVEKVRFALLPIIEAFRSKWAPAPRSSPAGDTSSVGYSPPASLNIGLPPSLLRFRPAVLVIGSSTGGPMALENLFIALKDAVPRVPILICQHMPPVFTASLAKRLEVVCGIPASEGLQGESIKPGRIYVAPGDYHMVLAKGPNGAMVRLHQGPAVNSVRPAVDPLFESAAEVFGASVLSVVLTGMGADGAIGAERIRGVGGKVLIQDQASCVVFGMPGAVAEKKAFDGMGDPTSIGQFIRRMISE